MKNFVQDGDVITVTAPYAVSSGGGVLVGANLFGVATSDIANGAQGEIAVEGVFDLPKTSALAITTGDRLFWDNTNKVVNKTATAQVCVGIALSDAANPSSTVRVLLQPTTPAGT